ncbi:DNA polymerase-3 subunit delta [Marmoricola sp. OAE513]|uniref:DNA polymerase III subunit delta n=1 Tax=Marmoricola sp. OAE513 TaxID=2817894 RepID=UPI001AE75663
MAAPDPSQVLGRVTLVTGPEEFMAERTVQSVRASVRQADPEAEFSETTADLLTMATLGELAAPSLFSSTRCVVVRSFEDLPEESVPGLLEYVGAPAEDVALVLVHGGGSKGSGVLTKLRKLASVTEVKSTSLTAREFPGFVVSELRAHQVRIDQDAAAYLVQAVGQDLRSLAAAASQLAGDFGGQAIGIDMVKTYFGGRADAKAYAIADNALLGRPGPALEELRWALETGASPVMITGAVANSLRSLASFKASPRGTGMPDWKVRNLRSQANGWHEGGLARAIRVVANADAEIKGKAHDSAYALEKMVLQIVEARQARA